ncbi:MAG TPA: hypothetical protein V6C97_08450 [Oculatellaceae cyanobacterium]
MYSRVDPSLFDVLEIDDTLPIDPVVTQYWLKNLKHPFRATVMHVCRLVATLTLCSTYFLKRLLPFQFSAHNLLQGTICWFMKWFVTAEANVLILRHFWTETNLINFIILNSRNKEAPLVRLYPKKIDDLMEASFIQHDVVLFNALHDLGSTQKEDWPVPSDKLDFSGIREIEIDESVTTSRWTQFLDFETAHETFKALFCLLLRADEYERSINSLQFDQTMALRIGRIVGDPELGVMAYNGFPLFLVGPLRLSQRFVMHGLFTEHLHAYLLQYRDRIRA